MEVAVCTGSSCEMRCAPGFDAKCAFEELAKDDENVNVVAVNCMNQCKRGPVVRLTKEDELQTVPERMNSVEQQRKAFQNVGGAARVEAIWGVASAIADGSRTDGYGEFSCESHGPLPPSAM